MSSFIPPVLPGTPVAPYGDGSASPWSSLLGGIAGFGAMGALMAGFGRREREPETKREKALKTAERLSDLSDALEDMIRDAECLLGSEAQGTISPFNAEVNAAVGEIALLRRRAMIVRSRLHALVFPKIKDDLQKIGAQIDAAEASVAEVLAMPDLTPEEEAALKQAHKDKRFVVQALALDAEPRLLQEIAQEANNMPIERAEIAIKALVDDGLVEVCDDGYRRVQRRMPEPPKPESPRPESPTP